MRLHPEIEIVSLNRGEDYASAARLGAPQARQVADRFHLAKNLTEIVEEILARCRAEIRQASELPDASSSDQPKEKKAEQVPSLSGQHTDPDPLAGNAHNATSSALGAAGLRNLLSYVYERSAALTGISRKKCRDPYVRG
jgi:transposase